MVKPVLKAEINAFTKGIITEASPLNFPPDASKDEENFKINKDGSRQRRLGMDFELNHAVHNTELTPLQIAAFGNSTARWLSANKDPNNEFAVVQFGNKVHIFDATKDSISGQGFLGTVYLPVIDQSTSYTYASVDGVLVIAAGTEEIYTVTYDGVSFTLETGRLQVRDLWGMPSAEGNDINNRPTSLTQPHLYNLLNQGWGIPRKGSSGTLADPILLFFTEFGTIPAPSEAVTVGLQYQQNGSDPFERIFPKLYQDVLGLGSPPAKGYFIIDALRRGTSRLTAAQENKTKYPELVNNVTDLPEDTTTKGCSVVAEYAGRVFYAGFGGEVTGAMANTPALSSYVLFSQLVSSPTDITKCYQQGDPTSRENSDVVDTDGGFIRISGAKKILGMVTLSDRLIVLADNGVWSIKGGSDYGFGATNYLVTKLSTYGCVGYNSIVVENDHVYYWGDSGIFLIAKDQFGDLKVTNISETTIQKLYNNIPVRSREIAKGIYDPLDKIVRWLYNTDSDRSNSNNVFEIVLDTTLGAFYKNRFYSPGVGGPDIVGYIQTSAFLTSNAEETVVVGEDVVTVQGVDVTLQSTNADSGIKSIKYLCVFGVFEGAVGFTFATPRNTDFKDWFTYNGVGVDAFAYLITGDTTAGDSSIAKQSPYLIMHFFRTEDGVETVGTQLVPRNQSSCKCRVQWDWADSIASKKWSPLFQAYRYRRPLLIDGPSSSYDNGFQTVVSKNKLRGRGKALSLYMETEPEKDCRIIGWSLSLTGNNLA